MFRILLAFQFLSIITQSFVYNNAPTKSLLTTLESEIKGLIDANQITINGVSVRHRIATLTPLGYHDCINEGVCNGCINLNNPENDGLDVAINFIEPLYNSSYKTKLSRADFWAFSATIAVKYGAQLKGQSAYVPNFQFKWGRQDCPTSPNSSALNVFPGPYHNTAQVTDFFGTYFGLSQKETVALMGAHTLGRGHYNLTGFDGPWVVREDVLDNAYFVDLVDTANTRKWYQEILPNNFYQWTDHTKKYMMLNCDVAMYKSFPPTSNGSVPSCPMSLKNCSNSATAQYVTAYAQSNQMWLDDFALVWDKILSRNVTLYNVTDSSSIPSTCPASLCQKGGTTSPMSSTSTTSSGMNTTTTANSGVRVGTVSTFMCILAGHALFVL